MIEYLTYTKEERQQTIQSLEREMGKPEEWKGNQMLKTYEVRLSQSDIEFIDDILDRFVPEHPTLHDEILGLRLTLNAVLTCEAGECDNPRKGLDTLCAYCAAVRDDARATYQGAVQAGWIHPTEGI